MKIKINIFLFILTIICLSFNVIASNIVDNSNNSRSENYGQILVRIIDSNEDINNLEFIDIIGGRPNEWYDVSVPENKLEELTYYFKDIDIISWDVDSYLQTINGDYHTFSEMEQILFNFSNNYPEITKLSSQGKSYEDRNIWCLEISDNPGIDENEPGVFFIGLHHAREWPTLEICLYIIEKLTSEYASDPEITNIVDNRRIWIVPCVNPDGYFYSHDQGIDWRKNRHYFDEYETIGVDLNRNYAGSSNGDGFGSWGSIGDGYTSHDPVSELYCGPMPFSELETQAIRNIFLENDICALISWHTYGELVMWPWGYSIDEKTPDQILLQQIGEGIASRITGQDGEEYLPIQAAELYPTTGDTTDWAYGYSHYVLGRSTFAYTIEACNSYHPPASELGQITKENFDGAFYLLQEAQNIRDYSTPRVLPPNINEIIVDTDKDYTLEWVEKNPKAQSEFYQLDEITGISINTDTGGFDDNYWNFNRFHKTNFNYHSPLSSYYSGKFNQDTSWMTLKKPLPVTEGAKLSFWCSYDTELNHDYCFLEISQDARIYDIIDTYTGSSNGWVYKEYNLSKYQGKSIFIRFRYTTNYRTTKQGFYIDDITPVANYEHILTISDTITEKYYEFRNKQDGEYYYRVKGYNNENGWGDFSTLKKVTIGDNIAPDKPTIDGPKKGKAGEFYEYSFSSYDPENDPLYYFIDWGDGHKEEWIGPYASNKKINLSHKFTNGIFIIGAKVKDIHSYESKWTTFEVIVSKGKIISNSLNFFNKIQLIFRYISYKLDFLNIF
jgi:hypothetical protein